MSLRNLLGTLALGTSLLFGSAACSINTRPVEPPRAPVGSTHVLLQSVHLGDNRADGQAFGTGASAGARVCALVSLPSGGADVTLRIQGLRNSEVLADVLTVNGRRFPLGITLERSAYPSTSNAMVGAPVFHDHLIGGPNQICLVAGERPSGDLDDFEVEQVLVDVHGVPPGQVAVNVLTAEGTPPLGAPPSLPWGTVQGGPAGAHAATPWWAWGQGR